MKLALEQKPHELVRSLEMMRATLESTTDAIVVTSFSGGVFFFNERFLQLWQVQRDRVASGSFWDLMREFSLRLQDPKAFDARLEEIQAGAPAQTSDVLTLRDGRIYEQLSRTQILSDQDTGRVWTFKDVTAQKKADDAVREQREWFEVTLSSIGDAVITTGKDGRITFLNHVAARMTGWSASEAMGRPLEDVFRIVHEDTHEPAANPMAKVLREGVVGSIDKNTALISRDGTEIPIDDSVAPIRDASGGISGAVMVFHDVTERRLADRALHQSRERLETALAAASTGTFRWTLRTDVIEGDESIYRLFEVEPGHGLRNLEEFCSSIPVEHRARVMNEFRLRAQKPGEFDVDFPIQLPRVGTRWLHCKGRSFVDASGRATYLTGACVDVSEKRRAEEARYWLAAVVESSDDAIVTKTLEGIVMSWNCGAQKMFGYTEKEIIGKSITLLIPPDRQGEEKAILNRLRQGQRIESYETIRVRKDGKLLDISLTVSPILNPNGEIVGASKIARDVTARKRTEAALLEEYVITEQLNDVARALATELDLKLVARIITEAGRRITRARFGAFFQRDLSAKGEVYRLETLSGMSREVFELSRIPAPETFFADTHGKTVLRVNDIRMDVRFARDPALREDVVGNPWGLSYLAVPVAMRDHTVLGGLLFGGAEAGAFTERDERILVGVASQGAAAMDTARAYQAEQQARSAAEHANRAKDLFLAALSHELRTPLTPALAILSSVCQEPSISNPWKDELETVRRNVELEARLIDDLLDLTRISHGKLELHCSRVRVERILDDVITTCRHDLEARGLTLVLDIRDPELEIIADGARVTQILWNLVKNSIKFTPEGGTITIRSYRMPEKEGGRVVLEVQDTGIGIEPARIDRVFEAFEQGDRGITQLFGGLGLGLAISRAIAERHQGTLTAKSPGPSMGSTFTLQLPFVGCEEPDDSSRQPSSDDSAAPATLAGVEQRSSLLLVEDHADTARALGTLLQKRGYQVTVVDSVAGALEKARARRFDVVVSDLGLPDGTGYELMRQLRDEHSIPGIALSGYGMEEDVQKCYAAGFVEHLVKPVQVAKLLRALDRVLARVGPS